MSKTENKDKHEREAMPFAFRWRRTLDSLSDGDFREMVLAILDFGELGQEPQFEESWKKALWNEFRDRIQHDKDRYLQTCSRRSQKRGIKGDGDGEGEGNGEGNGKGDGDIAYGNTLYPETTEDVLAIAEKIGMTCAEDQAILYLATRQATDWLDASHKRIKNVEADLKRWIIRGADEMRKHKRVRAAGEGQWQV